MKITLAQLNPIVGDVVGNVRKIRETYLDAEERGVDLVVFPELSVTGFPLEDLADTGDLLDAAALGLEAVRSFTKGRKAAVLVGAPIRGEGADGEAAIHNAALVFEGGKKIGETHKQSLPRRGGFDEKSHFTPGRGTFKPIEVKGRRLGVLIREDSWVPSPAAELKANGAEAFVVINASPFRPHILEIRIRDIAAHRVHETGLPLIYVNQVGGQDELVFDGGAFFMDAGGRRVRQSPQWEECVIDGDLDERAGAGLEIEYPDPREEIWRAMALGLKDYVRKSGFTDVVVGLSGGIDSAVVAAVAGDALGKEHVHCLRLPSQYTSDLSNSAAAEMCKLWGFDMRTVSISPVVKAALETLPDATGGAVLKKVTLENMQARVRGFLLMTLSNEYNWLLLSTGNKSEIAVGYATLYGDMCGAFNPLKDVFKTMVFRLAKWRNSVQPKGLLGPGGVVIPVEIIERAPSAELSPGQQDTDSLPPYAILDGILHEMVEKREPLGKIAENGYDPAVVERVYRMLKQAEYKRRQGAPGPKTSDRSFARDRRIPMVNGLDIAQLPILRGMVDNSQE